MPHIEGRFATVGVIAEVMEEGDLPGGLPAVAIQGEQRATIGTGVPGTGDALWVEAEPLTDVEPTPAANELAREYRAVLENILLSRGAGRIAAALRDITEPSRLADVAGYSPDLSLAQKVEVLETLDVEARLRLVLGWARDTLADLTLREQIKTDVEEGMEKTQREFLLAPPARGHPQGAGTAVGPRGRRRPRRLPGQARVSATCPSTSAPRSSARSTSSSAPATRAPRPGGSAPGSTPCSSSPGASSPTTASTSRRPRRILDADHDGLKDVKDRILEHLAVRKLQAERGLAPVDGRGSGAILALVGPPGVGKTSLGESVANALGRKFVRVSLGGVRDEAEIRGHRRTYVGAQPGRLVRALREAGTMNPVIVLDEVDKLGTDYRGDPSSALLEVLDPAQNHTFRDHYLEVDLDLSRVLFIATANVIDTIPGPLLDRMEVIRLDGYTENEKVSIARHHLVGRQLRRAALRDDEVEFTDEALRTIVADYTREAGVRNLERELGRLLRKVATTLASGERTAPIVVDGPDVRGWLGRPHFFFEAADRTSVPGVVTGLAVTGAGGDVLFVEASVSDGPEGLTLTGQLGDVMKESAEIALSYVRSHAEELGIDSGAFSGKRFHVHVPAGAVPKDGPSAGVTMTTALVSLLRDVPVRPVVGMTGEVTLQGRVLPIGGVKQKVLAAHRAGLTEVVLPVRNGPDLEDVPEEVREVMTFHLATTISDVLTPALEGGEGTPAVEEQATELVAAA